MNLSTLREFVNNTPLLSATAKPCYRLMDCKHYSLLRTCPHPKAGLIYNVLQNLPKVLDTTKQSAISSIEHQRDIYKNTHTPLSCDPQTSLPFDRNISVAQASKDSKRAYQCKFFYLLAEAIGAKNIIELGTNLGISSAYMALALKQAGSDGKLTTFDVSPDRLALAKAFHHSIELDNIHYIEGLFEHTLSQTLKNLDPADLVFIDGHHQHKPTARYFSQIIEHTSENAVFIIDDIRWNDGMRKAWQALMEHPSATLSVDLYSMGILCLGDCNEDGKAHIPTLHNFWYS